MRRCGAPNISAPARETPGGKHRGVYCRPRGSWWRLRLPPAQPERRLLQRMPTWPLAAGRSPSASPPPACKRDMAARRATVGRRAGVFLVFLLAIYYFYRECLGGQYIRHQVDQSNDPFFQNSENRRPLSPRLNLSANLCPASFGSCCRRWESRHAEEDHGNDAGSITCTGTNQS